MSAIMGPLSSQFMHAQKKSKEEVTNVVLICEKGRKITDTLPFILWCPIFKIIKINYANHDFAVLQYIEILK